MGRTAFLVAAALAATFGVSGTCAGETAAPPAAQKEYPSGFLSHGDSGDILEDFFGGRVTRETPKEPGGTHKRDPAIRWDGPATAR